MRRNTQTFAFAILAPWIAGSCAAKQADTAQTPATAPAATDAEAAERAAKAEKARQKQAMLDGLEPLPGIGAGRPVVFPEPTSFELDNGLQVIVLEDHELPTVRMQIAVRAGDIYSPAERPALAGLTSQLLGEGTKKRKKAEIDALIDATGGAAGAGNGQEIASLSADMFARDLDLALSVLAEEAMQPAFPEDALGKLKDQAIQGVRSTKSNPNALARLLMSRRIYGAESPYGRGIPREDAISATTRDEIVQFHATHWLPNQAMLVVVGDVKPEAVRKAATRHFGKWKRGPDVPTPHGPSNAAPTTRSVHIVDRPGSAQATVAIGVGAPKIGTAGWLEMQVVENVLAGGTLTTRLNLVLREELGLTYGATADHAYGHDGGMFLALGGTKTKSAPEFADAMMPLVFDLASKELSDRELGRVKNMVSGNFALQAEGADFVAGRTVIQRLYGLPTDFWTKYRSEIEAVTPKALHATAATTLDRNRVQIVAVGQRKKLEESLARFGEVHVYDADLQPLK